jgi:cyclopropane fatty-acyl-phospholipid synthase-like methyltransferase
MKHMRLQAALVICWSLLICLPAFAQAPASKPLREPDVWYVPTSHEVVEEMLRMGSVTSRDVIYDLGCGDGRIVIAAAKKFGTRGVGIDIDPERIQEAKANAKKEKVEHLVTFRVADLFETDISEASVVTLYLLPELNRRLIPKLKKELKPGSRIVSHDFDMGRDWPAEQSKKIGPDGIYLWTIR